jgi:hypothetical protein
MAGIGVAQLSARHLAEPARAAGCLSSPLYSSVWQRLTPSLTLTMA